MQYDVIVIGAGPGGARAAAVAAAKGKKTALIEKGDVGGTCLNVGCIPTKTLVHAAILKRSFAEATAYGMTVPDVSVDPAVLFQKKDAVVATLRKGSETSIEKQSYDFIRGEAVFTEEREIAVAGERYTFEYAIIATGSQPRELSGIPCDGKRVLNSTQLLSLNALPRSIVIIGGGYIGCEWASLLAGLGSTVTVVEMTDTLIPSVSRSVAARLEARFKKQGITVMKKTKVMSARAAGELVTVNREGGEPVTAEYVLVSVGRRAILDGIGLDAAGVAVEKGFVKTDCYCMTTNERIYAVGDVLNAPQLAHTAFHEAFIIRKRMGDQVIETGFIWNDRQCYFYGSRNRFCRNSRPGCGDQRNARAVRQ